MRRSESRSDSYVHVMRGFVLFRTAIVFTADSRSSCPAMLLCFCFSRTWATAATHVVVLGSFSRMLNFPGVSGGRALW